MQDLNTDCIMRVIHAIPDPIFIMDGNFLIRMANRAFGDLVKLPDHELAGRRLDTLTKPGVCPAFRNPADLKKKSEILFKHPGEKAVPFQITLLSEHLCDEDVSLYMLKDIGSIREVEVSLIESESLYQTLVNQLPNPIVIHINGKVVFANDLIIEVTGLTNEEVIGKNIAELMTDPNGPTTKLDFGSLMWDSLMEEEEFEIRTEDRKLVIKSFLMRNSRIKYKGQDAVMTILIDMTERRHLEKYILNRVIETEEKDRKQFAADLHDDLGPMLGSIKLHLGLLDPSKGKEKFDQTLKICHDQLSEVISRMRVIANNLMPRLIEKFGLEAALNSFVQTLHQEGVFEIAYTSNLNGLRFSRFNELHLYRIICELLNNTVKHSGATRAAVQLNFENNLLTLNYTDNGKGYDIKEIEKQGSGLGVGNIIQRANLIDARIRFTREGRQTRVTITKEL